MKRPGMWLLLVVLMGACRPDTVTLAYEIEEGAEFRYRIDARAEASWGIGGAGSGSYDVSFEVTETVRDVDPSGATVDVAMEPIDATERGLPSPGLESRSFTLRLGPDGEVLEVLDLNGISATALDAEQLAFLGTYRPALPEGPVRLEDSWSAHQGISVGADIQQLETEGRLRTLHTDARGAIASIDFDGIGPIAWETELPQGAATLEGEARTTGSADLDIEDGRLREARSLTSGDFEVRVAPESGEAPISGTLQLELELTVEELVE